MTNKTPKICYSPFPKDIFRLDKNLLAAHCQKSCGNQYQLTKSTANQGFLTKKIKKCPIFLQNQNVVTFLFLKIFWIGKKFWKAQVPIRPFLYKMMTTLNIFRIRKWKNKIGKLKNIDFPKNSKCYNFCVLMIFCGKGSEKLRCQFVHFSTKWWSR